MSSTGPRGAGHESDSPAKGPAASADRPIDKPSEDRLGRDGFASKLAKVVADWKQRDSLVLGLHGPWGGGKTSLINLVLRHLGEGTEVVRFNPWEWSGQDKVMAAFFATMTEGLGGSDAAAAAKKAAKAWKLAAVALEIPRAALGAPSKLLSWWVKSGGVALLSLAAAAWFGLSLTGVTVALVFVGLLMVASQWLLARLVAVLSKIQLLKEAEAAWHEETLTQAKARLHESMRGLGHNVLVVVDDIDRLTPPQMLQVFQLVKANADFPNLVFFLVYEREVVVAGLKHQGIVKPREFLQKVVQLEFDLPLSRRKQLQAVLFDGLEALLQRHSLGPGFDSARWASLLQAGFGGFFRTLRDIKRYLNTLEVHAEAHLQDGHLEADIVDLFGIEALRVFEHDLYLEVRKSKRLLTARGQDLRPGHGRPRETLKAQSDALLQTVSEADRDRLERVLAVLFPPLLSIRSNRLFGASEEARWDQQARVCSPPHFDAYFTLALGDDVISKGEVEGLLSVSSDVVAFRSLLQDYKDRGRLDDLLLRLESYKEDLAPENLQPIATALFDISDGLPEAQGFFDLDPVMHLVRIIYHFAVQIHPDERDRSLLGAFEATFGLQGPAHYLSLELPPPARSEEKPPRASMSDGSIEVAKSTLLGRFRKGAIDGSLWEHNDLHYLLWRWWQWSEAQEEVRDLLLARLMSRDHNPVPLLRRFTLKVRTLGGASATTLREHIDNAFFREVLGGETTLAVCEQAKSFPLTPDEEEFIRALRALASEGFPPEKDDP